ncbi:MAG: hypothetical protein RLZZ458_3028, partial [Planctomycetota bacterium]
MGRVGGAVRQQRARRLFGIRRFRPWLGIEGSRRSVFLRQSDWRQKRR